MASEPKTMWLLVLYMMAGYAIIIPATFIPDTTVRSIVVVAGQFSILPGLFMQKWMARVHGTHFKIWRVTLRSRYAWKTKTMQWMMKKDPVSTIEDETKWLPVSEQARGWRRAKVVFDKSYWIKHPEFGRQQFVYVDFNILRGEWRERILQLDDKVVIWGLLVPHNATDRVTLWEREANVDLNIPVVDELTQRYYAVFELREASGDMDIIEEKRAKQEAQLAAAIGR